MNDEIRNENDDFEEEQLIESPVKRALMVLFSPGLVFKSLSEKSSKLDWIIPVTLSIIFTLIFVNTCFEYIRNDQHETAIQRIENNTKLSDEQKTTRIEQIEQYMEKMAGFQRIMGNIGSVFGVFGSVLLIALVIKLISKYILHHSLIYGDAFRICALGSMTSLVGTIVRMPLVLYLESMKEAKISLKFLFPESMEDSIVATFFDIDIFFLWYTVIICIGMSVFAKTPLRKALIPVAVILLVIHSAIIAITKM
ncbi:YIP1 family protein [Candidatus Omnitrophota bacterium]